MHPFAPDRATRTGVPIHLFGIDNDRDLQITVYGPIHGRDERSQL